MQRNNFFLESKTIIEFSCLLSNENNAQNVLNKGINFYLFRIINNMLIHFMKYLNSFFYNIIREIIIRIMQLRMINS